MRGPRTSAFCSPRPEFPLYHTRQLLSIGKLHKDLCEKNPEIVQCDENYFCANCTNDFVSDANTVFVTKSQQQNAQKLIMHFVQYFLQKSLQSYAVCGNIILVRKRKCKKANKKLTKKFKKFLTNSSRYVKMNTSNERER